MAVRIDEGFTLALGGGGARGWAHIGVARALEERGLRPRRVVGTSMGAIIGAGIAAGRSADQMEEVARRTSVYKLVGRPGRLALFDPRPLLERMARELDAPRIEDLPTPLGITTFDLVAGRPRLITSGPLVDALEVSIAVPFVFPPRRDPDGVWCDAGPWEGVPVSQARAWDPELPVVGVWADIPKPAILSSRFGAAALRAVSARLTPGTAEERLTARRFLGLLTQRWADPVVEEPPDLLIRPRLGLMSAWQFGKIAPAVEIGERDARDALATLGDRTEDPSHA
ncbi:MAG TPA: patatin-like phospholipase family protein [Candidatus Limnocylindrales bacterium]|nr:patatin-like phospholipase family protein [Candidatus Limnocylindrales bacterium]